MKAYDRFSPAEQAMMREVVRAALAQINQTHPAMHPSMKENIVKRYLEALLQTTKDGL